MTNKKGFSLIAIATILVVIGAAVLLSMLPQSDAEFEDRISTQDRLDRIRIAVTRFYSQNGGVYPCPARFDLLISNNNFGNEINATCQTTPFTCPVTAGIVCPTGSATTWVGAVPVKALNLPDEFAFDEWGNRITYAVNNNTTFRINDAAGNQLTLVNFHAFSHGPNGMGSYLRTGAANPSACTQGAWDANASEFQNCNFATDNIFLYRAKDTATGSTTYYDDVSFRY